MKKIRLELLLLFCRIKIFFNETIPMKIAFDFMPNKVKLWVFIEIAGMKGDCPFWYSEYYKHFVKVNKIKGY